jgi:geranylgeranyl reductase family protein
MPENKYSADVVIVGAGPAGSTAAALLARDGWDVLLVDRAEFPRDKTCGDGLTPRAVAVLDRLGVLPALTSSGYQRINGALTVAPNGAVFHVRFGDFRLGLPDYGLVVPRFELDDRLRRHAMTLGARFISGMHVTGPLRQGDRVTGATSYPVTGVEGQAGGQAVKVEAPLTIVATGASIGLLRSFGVLSRMPPTVSAIRGYFTNIPDLGDEFEFYFDRELTAGYAWIFPLADGRANVGLGLFNWYRRDNREANTRRLLADFMARHPRLAAARPDGPVKGYPLRTDFPRYRSAGRGYLLTGEALGLVHPITGEGIDLAMESAEFAATAADAALRSPNPGKEAPAAYSRALKATYGRFFRAVHVIEQIATRPVALNRLLRKAPQHPYLARTLAGINLGVVSPWAAFYPRTWWEMFT